MNRSFFFFKRKHRTPGTFVLLLMTIFTVSARAQLHPVPAESSVSFSIRNFGFGTGGKLGPPEGEIIFNPDNLTQSSFHVTIHSTTINTDNASRDEHLREEDYFDVKNYPLIKFVSTSIQSKGKNEYVATGTLTIKNISKTIQLPFTADKKENGFLFKGSFKLKRKDYHIGGSSTISDELTVDIKVLAQ